MKNLKKLNNSKVKNVRTVQELVEMFQDLGSYSYQDGKESHKPKATMNEILESKGMKFRFLHDETHVSGMWDDAWDYGDLSVIPSLENRHEESPLDEASELELMDFGYAYRNYVEANRKEMNVGAWTPVCVEEFLSNEWQEIENQAGPEESVLKEVFSKHPIKEGWKTFDLLDMIWAYDFYIIEKFDEQEFNVLEFFDFLGSDEAEQYFNLTCVA